MTRQQAVEFIQRSNGRFFSVVFVKRTTNEVRLMLCRTGVKKHLRGGIPTYDPQTHGLISVYDMHKEDYRSVPTEGITQIKVKGNWVSVE